MRLFYSIWKIWFVLVFAISLTLLFPIFYVFLLSEKTHPFVFRLKKLWGWFLRTMVGIIPITKYNAPIPKGPVIICPNHSSYLDIIMMYSLNATQFSFLGKQEISQWPLFHIFFTKGMDIFVDRSSVVKSHQSLQKAAKKLDQGISLIIFPEATIPGSVPKMKRFKNGAFKLAIEKGVPIVPVSFLNNYKMLQNGGFFKAPGRPGISRIEVHEAIKTKGLTQDDLIDLREKTFNIIQKPVLEYGNK